MAALGIIKAYWNGQSLPLTQGSALTLGGVTSKPRVVGRTIESSNAMEPSEISLKVAVQTGMVITSLFPSGVKGELQVECDSGQTFVWENAFRSGPIKISTGDSSEADVTFAGGTPLEL